MAFVTTFCPFMTTGAGKLVLQTAGKRFVVDSKVNPAALVGHAKTMLAPQRVMASCGPGNEILNTVPPPELPPVTAVPYSVLRDKINPPAGNTPSLRPVKV